MTFSIVLSARAVAELADAWSWYEDRQPGLGDDFKAEVYTKLYKVAETPSIGIKRKRIFYEVLVKRFPYIVVYRIDKRSNIVFIQSIFHTSRNPAIKYKQ